MFNCHSSRQRCGYGSQRGGNKLPSTFCTNTGDLPVNRVSLAIMKDLSARLIPPSQYPATCDRPSCNPRNIINHQFIIRENQSTKKEKRATRLQQMGHPCGSKANQVRSSARRDGWMGPRSPSQIGTWPFAYRGTNHDHSPNLPHRRDSY